ncbi:hypothetical protein M409DRAFT_49179 [Zasmidium cellare ATCC 36951]|uniref:F-box domain-containing protein n=1 Tax=Zasmidium cellare ATCC 36951 TaxID=1080233 RepID=A0A6A6CZG7_ZASCE|nr:uncharacterized protein M409DRAFT_49179 [Zasmidium cellare ATCC 36951]KAF2172627.1 hypothetical protein M409DRAFT_49179 [Zasmidium cellare ATCC 36951]
MHEPTPPLLTLPPELQIEIAELVDSTSLLALRQVNRELAANTFEVFGRRFFSYNRHATTNHSLRVLRDITATPELARHFKKLEFIAIGTGLEYDEYSSMPGAYPLETDEAGPWRREVDDAYGWQDSGVLHDIFENLARTPGNQCLTIEYRKYRTIGAFHLAQATDDQPTAPDSTLPEANLAHVYGLVTYQNNVRPWIDEWEVRGQSPLNIVQAILEALFKSSYRPSGLALSIPSTGIMRQGVDYTDTWITRLSAKEREGLNQVCRRLKNFELNLHDAGSLSPTVQRLLPEMSNLRCLSVSSTSTPVLETIARHLATKSLQKIHLTNVFGPPEGLQAFLSHYTSSYEEILLDCILFWTPSSRKVFEYMIRSYTKLQIFKVRLLVVHIDHGQLPWQYHAQNLRLYKEESDAVYHTYRGEEKIKGALSMAGQPDWLSSN